MVEQESPAGNKGAQPAVRRTIFDADQERGHQDLAGSNELKKELPGGRDLAL